MNEPPKRRRMLGFAQNYDFRRVRPSHRDTATFQKALSRNITDRADAELDCDAEQKPDTESDKPSTPLSHARHNLGPLHEANRRKELSRDDWTRWSHEDARLAAERIGMWGERAKDGTIKPVVSQQPKEEYL